MKKIVTSIVTFLGFVGHSAKQESPELASLIKEHKKLLFCLVVKITKAT
jgi:hypothetical protein